jgi:hypothetical protein
LHTAVRLWLLWSRASCGTQRPWPIVER